MKNVGKRFARTRCAILAVRICGCILPGRCALHNIAHPMDLANPRNYTCFSLRFDTPLQRGYAYEHVAILNIDKYEALILNNDASNNTYIRVIILRNFFYVTDS